MSGTNHLSLPPAPPPAPIPAAEGGMNLQLVYHTLFRHKWKIIICALAGAIGAVTIFLFRKPVYQSEAKLFIRYVVSDAKNLSPRGTDEIRKSPDMRGETIMDSEVEILTSLDLAKQVAEQIGPDKILPKNAKTRNIVAATAVIGKGLQVEVPPHSSVIRIIYRHSDPDVVQPVVKELTERYLKKHVEIHRNTGGTFLNEETDQLRSRLQNTEDELRKARNKARVISLDEAKKSYSEQIARLRQQIQDAEAEMAERAATLQELVKTAPSAPSTPSTSPAPAPAEEPAGPTSAQIDEYKRASNRLILAQNRELQLLTQFTEENQAVKEIREQILEAAEAKRVLEAKTPGLRQTAPTMVATTAAPEVNIDRSRPGIDPREERTRLVGLESRLKVLNAQLEQVRSEVTNIDQMELAILELTRRKELEDTNYRFYAASLEQARISEALGDSKIPNISQIQTPTPPFVDNSKTMKTMGMVGFGGLAFGLAWAFLIEMYLDRSVRRPAEVEGSLGLRLFISVPRQKLVSPRRKLFKRAQKVEALSTAAGETPVAEGKTDRSVATALRPFHETLRDRLIGYFERRGLVHKPKLIALTGIGRGAGVTSTAAGLASALSETGEGSVLLVDMTPAHGSATQFSHGQAVGGLESVLESSADSDAQDNLCVVSDNANNESVSRFLPQRFSKLLPKLKTSRFDYIIFDMPPISQISVTPRLAGFMDMVLLVLESEKTDRDAVARATAMLAESRADVCAVLNKTRSYGPAWLTTDQLSSL